MERRVTREKVLNACRCGVDALEALVVELTAFYKPSDAIVRIEVNLPNEVLEFRDFDELRAYDSLPPTLYHVRVSMEADESPRSIEFGALSSVFLVRVKGESPAWCAGGIEIVRDFGKRHGKWYSGGLVPLFAMILGAALPFIWYPPKGDGFMGYLFADSRLLATFFVAVSLGLPLTFLFYKIAPSAFAQFVVVHRREDSYYRRNSTEIMLGLTAIPAVAVVVSLIKGLIERFGK